MFSSICNCYFKLLEEKLQNVKQSKYVSALGPDLPIIEFLHLEINNTNSRQDFQILSSIISFALRCFITEQNQPRLNINEITFKKMELYKISMATESIVTRPYLSTIDPFETSICPIKVLFSDFVWRFCQKKLDFGYFVLICIHQTYVHTTFQH